MDPVGTETVFGRSIKISGELHGSEDVSIEGDFEGVVRLDGATLTVGQDARVRANIAAKDVVVYGKVEGEIRATGSVSLLSHSVVIADIFASRFSIEDGAALRGLVDPSRALEPIPAVHEVWPSGARSDSPAVDSDADGIPSASSSASELPRLFEVRTSSSEHSTSMPAGLAAAARHFREVASSSTEPSGSKQTPDGPPEFAKTQA